MGQGFLKRRKYLKHRTVDKGKAISLDSKICMK